MGPTVGYMTGGAACLGILIGDELGLYQVLAGKGPWSAEELAADTECNPRLVGEGLDRQAVAGLVDYEIETGKHSMSAEAVMALAHDSSPVFTARAMNASGRCSRTSSRSPPRSEVTAGGRGATTTPACSRARYDPTFASPGGRSGLTPAT